MTENLQSITAQEVAEYFLWKSKNSSPIKPITNKKLQKLIYYSQAWFITLKSIPLFNEKIEAWVHGPVIKEIYSSFKSFNFSAITKKVDENIINNIPNEIKKFLDDVWSVYGKFDSSYLETLTHSETPWQKAREGLNADEISENEISLDSMREFYSSKLKKPAVQ